MHMDALSDEILARILSALPATALAQAEATCKHWQQLINCRAWPELFASSVTRYSAQLQDVPHSAHKLAADHKWKQAYCALQLQFRYQKQTSLKVRYLKGHDGPVVCLAACNNTIASGGVDKTVRVWNKKHGKCKAVLRAASSGTPHAIHMLTEDSILVRYKTTVLLWKGTRVQRTFSFQLELTDHAVADNSLFVSTSGSGAVEVWDIYSGLLLRIFRLEQASERVHLAAEVVHGKEVLLVASDHTIQCLDQATGCMLSMRTPRPRGAQSCVFTTGAKLFADGTAWIEYGGRLLTNHNSGLGCAAYYGSCVTLMFRLELQPSSQKAMMEMQGPDVVFPRRDRCITIRQENSSIHIQVTFDPFNDIELWAIYYAPCTESSTTMWYHAQEVRCTDAGLLPLALLHGSLLLTTTKSGHLAVWYLPEFSQDVQLP